jgi:hypothetical protein
MPGGPSLGRTLVVAAVVHVAFLVIAGRRQAPRLSVPLPEGEVTLVSVEPLPDVPVPAPLPSEATSHTEPPLPSDSAPLLPPRRNPIASRTEPVSSAMLAPESASPTAGWTLHVTPGQPGGQTTQTELAALALDGTNRFMGSRETPEQAARAAEQHANQAAGEAMRGALHDRDVSLGLGGGGPVVTALEAAVRQSTAPDESHAVLIAIADATGTVLRVEVESATDNPAYRGIAEDVLTRLRGQKLRVPEGSRGLAMRIDVASRIASPSGGGAGLDPRSMGAHFDIADLGAKPHRIIHARVLGEELL